MLKTDDIRNAVAENWSSQIAWLSELVSFPSTRGEEAPCQDWLAREFRSRGWAVDRYTLDDVAIAHLPGYSPVHDTDYARAVQLVAALRAPVQRGRSLILQGHVDVVPTGPAEMWSSPPFRPVIRDGRLYGRGSYDMKSGVCAMVFALDALRRLGKAPGSDVYVQTVTEEECTGNGALSTLARGYRADACLIPEPTGQNILRGTIGVMWFRLVVRGNPVHVHSAGSGANAILSAYPILSAIQQEVARLNRTLGDDPWFSRIENPIKFNVGRIRGGDWASSVPAWCAVDCRIGVPPGRDLAVFRADIAAVVEAAARRDPFLRDNGPEIVWNGFQAEDYVLPPGSAFEDTVRAAHRDVTGTEAEEIVLPAVTDCRFYGRYFSIPSLSYGVSGANAHGYDEYVDLDTLKSVTCTLSVFISKWCGLEEI
ncbi:ArgE/DapE family deacylase [Gluconacetobacter aggeris]|uniref:ArgE/DapE family deacylase n=1 Tax=Gluconacetobacter aggeris TaxID=1286186 RepID=A0A7W4IVK0_9PROT|nr:ArgE/DapE family deacylase [Gluconacetobacter aggeris]MBB2169854.1 ArgE/DapE family deacylase [Gluconacetobacter aggeris]